MIDTISRLQAKNEALLMIIEENARFYSSQPGSAITTPRAPRLSPRRSQTERGFHTPQPQQKFFFGNGICNSRCVHDEKWVRASQIISWIVNSRSEI